MSEHQDEISGMRTKGTYSPYKSQTPLDSGIEQTLPCLTERYCQCRVPEWRWTSKSASRVAETIKKDIR